MAGSACALGTPLIDIGANLLDPMFRGEYREKPRHQVDLPAVLQRAAAAGVGQIMVTAGSLEEAREALALCRSAPRDGSWPELVCTVGVHPTRCGEFEAWAEGPDAYLAALLAAGQEGAGGPCVAVGEFGLDYDRLQFCSKDVQLKFFERQLVELAAPLGLPLFLHCRTGEAAQDLASILEKHVARLPERPGAVHSFDGSLEDAMRFVKLGFCIGINGCSLRTQENLEVVKQLPGESIVIETDAPWCGIKATHAGHKFVRSAWDEVKKPEKWEDGKCVNGRCEPCHLRQVLEVVAGCRGEDVEALAAQTTANARRIFFCGRS